MEQHLHWVKSVNTCQAKILDLENTLIKNKIKLKLFYNRQRIHHQQTYYKKH